MKKRIGLLLGDEEDWPTTFEALVRRLGPAIPYNRKKYSIEVERIRIHPFQLDSPSRYDLVIDRLAYWHLNPREWLKKIALVNRVYLLNNPFTFQSMEKHSAYCAMIRFGMNVPETWLIPTKAGPDTEKYRVTARKYHDMFDLPAIAGQLDYPLYMKPFDGGGWRDVSRIENPAQLMEVYDRSGSIQMHLQAGLDGFDVFVRSLAIGPQVISMRYDPSQPMHNRYQIDHQFLPADKGREAGLVTRLINATFRWDFNSCEAILKDDVLWLIDFANACPDIALTSLHYYFPWALKALAAWSLYCTISGRRMRISMDFDRYFSIADSDRTYAEKLEAYDQLAQKHFETEKFNEFRHTQLQHLDEVMWELVGSAEFDGILVNTVQSTFSAYEHERFIAHYRGLMDHWRQAEAA
jgi:hypothetical protein